MSKNKNYTPSPHWYGVRHGFVPGVYRTWREAQRQIYGFRGALFQGFDRLEDAEAYAGVRAREDNRENPFVEVHEGITVARFPLTPAVRDALVGVGLNLDAR